MLVRYWASRATQLDANLVQQLLLLLNSPSTTVQTATLSVFRSLGRALPLMSEPLLRSADAYVRQLLFGDNDVERVNLPLNVLCVLPLQRLPEARLHELLEVDLAPNVFSSSAALRQRVYTLLTNCRHFWKTMDLSCTALALLLLGVGDVSSEAAEAAIVAILEVSSGPQ